MTLLFGQPPPPEQAQKDTARHEARADFGKIRGNAHKQPQSQSSVSPTALVEVISSWAGNTASIVGQVPVEAGASIILPFSTALAFSLMLWVERVEEQH